MLKCTKYKIYFTKYKYTQSYTTHLTAPDRYLNPVSLTICAGGRAGEFPVGETNRSQTATDVVMVIK